MTDALVPDMFDRMEAMNAESLLHIALRNCEPGNSSGYASKCWELDAHARWTAAKMSVLDFKSASDIKDHLGEMLKDIDKRVLSRWLKKVREAYGIKRSTQLAERQSHEQLAYANGDLVAVLGMTFADVAPKFISWIKSCPIADMPDAQKHIALRFLDIQITAAKVQSEARRSEAQTKNILSKLKQTQDMLSGEGKGPVDQSEVIKFITGIIDQELMGGAS